MFAKFVYITINENLCRPFKLKKNNFSIHCHYNT